MKKFLAIVCSMAFLSTLSFVATGCKDTKTPSKGSSTAEVVKTTSMVSVPVTTSLPATVSK